MIIYEILAHVIFFVVAIGLQYLYWSAVITPNKLLFTDIDTTDNDHPLGFINSMVTDEIDIRDQSTGEYLWNVMVGLALITAAGFLVAFIVGIGWPAAVLIAIVLNLINKRQKALKNQ